MTINDGNDGFIQCPEISSLPSQIVTGRSVMKNIQIPAELFAALYKCFVIDPDAKCEYCIGCTEVKRQLEEKGEKIYRRDLYTKSKTAASPSERETARQKYLDERGILPGFRYAQPAFPADDR